MFPIGIAVTVRGVVELTKRGDEEDELDESSGDNKSSGVLNGGGKYSVNGGGVSGYIDSTMRRQSVEKNNNTENESDEEAGVGDPLLKKSK